MTQAERAAAMFILLGEDAATEVMRHLNEREIERLAKQISSTASIPPEEAEKQAEELYQTLVASRFTSQGGVDYARKIVQKSLGAGLARRINARLSSDSGEYESLRALKRVEPMQLAQFLQHEHPQTIAVVLSQLSPHIAADILSNLPESCWSDVATRMATMDEVSAEVVGSVAEVLEARLQPLGKAGNWDGAGRIRTVAEMFNRMDRKISREVLEKIEETAPEISNSIRQVMFIFEDVTLLNDLAIREVLQRVDKKTIANALKGTDPELQSLFFRNMSQRASEMMREEMELMGPVRSEQVNAAQKAVITLIQQLEEEGVISIGRSGESEYVV